LILPVAAPVTLPVFLPVVPLVVLAVHLPLISLSLFPLVLLFIDLMVLAILWEADTMGVAPIIRLDNRLAATLKLAWILWLKLG
jgi:hypothetical protein